MVCAVPPDVMVADALTETFIPPPPDVGTAQVALDPTMHGDPVALSYPITLVGDDVVHCPAHLIDGAVSAV